MSCAPSTLGYTLPSPTPWRAGHPPSMNTRTPVRSLTVLLGDGHQRCRGGVRTGAAGALMWTWRSAPCAGTTATPPSSCASMRRCASPPHLHPHPHLHLRPRQHQPRSPSQQEPMARPSVVRIETSVGNGSGVIFETDGESALVLTNEHVVGYDATITITVNDVSLFTGTVAWGGRHERPSGSPHLLRELPRAAIWHY